MKSKIGIIGTGSIGIAAHHAFHTSGVAFGKKQDHGKVIQVENGASMKLVSWGDKDPFNTVANISEDSFSFSELDLSAGRVFEMSSTLETKLNRRQWRWLNGTKTHRLKFRPKGFARPLYCYMDLPYAMNVENVKSILKQAKNLINNYYGRKC